MHFRFPPKLLLGVFMPLSLEGLRSGFAGPQPRPHQTGGQTGEVPRAGRVPHMLLALPEQA